jgi:exopolyphosphatase/pppGpp-phosphohydrolase
MPRILGVQPLIRLHIGAMETVLSISVPLEVDTELVMPIGTVTTGRTYFRHDPPTALEIEHAIEAVEDALEGIGPALPAGATLQSADPLIGRIARLAGAGAGPARELVLGRDLVERSFDRLVAVSAGRPSTQDAIPTDPEFAAALLILRECMHHLHFESIAVMRETQ